jgi:hypothetical protein
MSRYIDPTGRGIQTAITLMNFTVPKKNTKEIDKKQNGKRCCGDTGPSSTYASQTKTCPLKHLIQEGPMIISLLYV